MREHRLLIQRCDGVRRAAPPAAADVPALPLARVGHGRGVGARHGVQLRDAAPSAVPVVRDGYVVALVELEEGTRLVTNLVGVAPDDVTIGMPVAVRFDEFDGGLVLPLFAPAGSQ